MQFCPFCGTKIIAGDFCAGCGKDLDAYMGEEIIVQPQKTK